jgi:asparagine synthase (glutamine-hydrolysing)
MCGICGIIYFDRNRQAHREAVENMIHVLRHRGPDDSGTWIKGNVGLGHVRLSIIDLSPLGHQPMCNEDGSVWITFNGEIYNYWELREDLTKRGHKFRSRTDTEVIVHLWEERGVDCLVHLRGMFALAIWDDEAKTLFLARDRMGKKPLFYAMLADRFLFGSEIKAILEDPEVKREPDIEAIHYYLTYQSVPSPYCAFKGIKKLPPAHSLLLKDGAGEPRRYWKLSYRNKIKVSGEAQEKELHHEIIERLREAVKIRLMSDVPLGAFLSGGVDSSLVVALMAGLMDQPVKTFSIGFDQDECNEVCYARMVADRYGTDHHEFVVTPDAQEIFPALVWHYNEPFADSSAIPTYYVSQLARETVTVVLNGDGGDENFAGYPRYSINGAPPTRGLRELVRGWLHQKRIWLGFVRQQQMWRSPKSLMRLSASKLIYYYRITHFHEVYQLPLYTPEMKDATRHFSSLEFMLDRYSQSDASSFLDASLDLDFGLYLPDTLMTKVDIATMAHSLEARSPLLDHRFIEFAATIPPNLKLKEDVISKYILKKAAEPYLPTDVIYRKKMGFGVPIDYWFRNELKEVVYDTLLSSRATSRGYFQSGYVRQILDRHQNSGESWQYLIWNLFMLELWHQMFIDMTLPMPNSTRTPAS